MRKSLSLSALLSSLLACPLYAAPPAPLARPQGASREHSMVLPSARDIFFEDALPSVSPDAFEDFARQCAAGAPVDAYGMRALNARIARDAAARLRDGTVFIAAPSPQEAQFIQNLRAMKAPMEKAAYLGVSTSPVDITLAEQLALPRGMGLVVDFVDQDSPADKAGIKVHDVLQKLEDQWLINAQQFAVLVRAKKPGDSLALTLIRAGKPLTVSATLAEKELPALNALPGMNNAYGFSGVPLNDPVLRDLPRNNAAAFHVERTGNTTRRTLLDDQHDITITTEGNHSDVVAKDRAGNLIYKGPADVANLPPAIKSKVEDLLNSRTALTFKTPPDGKAASEDFSMSLGRTDDEHTISLTVDKAGRRALIKDKSGTTLFDGPLNSDADIQKLPEPLQAKIRSLLAKSHLDDKLIREGVDTPHPPKSPE